MAVQKMLTNADIQREIRTRLRKGRKIDWESIDKAALKNQKSFEQYYAAHANMLGDTVAGRVDEALLVNNISPRELAVRCGITNHNYQGSWWWQLRRRIYENRFSPKLVTLCRIAKSLDMNVWELFEEYK